MFFYGRDSYEGERDRRREANGLRELMAHGLWDPKIGLLKKNPTSLNSPEMDVFRLSSMAAFFFFSASNLWYVVEKTVRRPPVVPKSLSRGGREKRKKEKKERERMSTRSISPDRSLFIDMMAYVAVGTDPASQPAPVTPSLRTCAIYCRYSSLLDGRCRASQQKINKNYNVRPSRLMEIHK